MSGIYNVSLLSLEIKFMTRHDSMADGAVVMKAPTAEHQQKFNLKYECFTSFLYRDFMLTCC